MSVQVCTPVYMYVETRGGHLMSSSIDLQLIILRLGLLVNWKSAIEIWVDFGNF